MALDSLAIKTPFINEAPYVSASFTEGTTADEVSVIETIAAGDFGADSEENWDILVAAFIDLQTKFNSMVVAYNASVPVNDALVAALERPKIISAS